ncbi:GNAT family N-acetyltransferase [Ferruginibacter paludis]|uniref:GNAT family N-acetyltransferase n=1 Tax=Ferruginibacter paludis TaxID=1310417 RepID=UPI0025B3D69F|nr:GNAT family N-acetyltransferase [Ferruginibacter paludis]MDN3655833.1 GNAT family N-acetyltransferase [Ferruginibacter paludis]
MMQLTNGKNVSFRLLDRNDRQRLYDYLNQLSAESKSRFGPHDFDSKTTIEICDNLCGDTIYFIAEDSDNNIIAYMLLKKGTLDADRSRYDEYNIYFDENLTATYAPSVADEWQNTGVGTAMFQHILLYLKNCGYKNLVLWGGVQTLNQRAIHFYSKHHFKQAGSFWYQGKDNLDMFLDL